MKRKEKRRKKKVVFFIEPLTSFNCRYSCNSAGLSQFVLVAISA